MKTSIKLIPMVFCSILICGFIVLQEAKSINITDSQNDVWSVANNQKGNYASSIDMLNIWQEGSEIFIECQTIFDETNDQNHILKYLVLLDSDSDHTSWEASILFIYEGSSNTITTYWTISDVQNSNSKDWQYDSTGVRYYIENDILIISFLEFSDIYSSNLVVFTEQEVIVTSAKYYDWAPDYYEDTVSFEDISILVNKYDYTNPYEYSGSKSKSSPGFTFLSILIFLPVLFVVYLNKRY